MRSFLLYCVLPAIIIFTGVLTLLGVMQPAQTVNSAISTAALETKLLEIEKASRQTVLVPPVSARKKAEERLVAEQQALNQKMRRLLVDIRNRRNQLQPSSNQSGWRNNGARYHHGYSHSRIFSDTKMKSLRASRNQLRQQFAEKSEELARLRVQPEPMLTTRPPTSTEKIRGQLKQARISFNSPQRLLLGESTIVELVVQPNTVAPENTEKLSSGLIGEVVEDAIEYSLKMEAKLTGADFEIPDATQQKTVLDDRPSKWSWNVTPTEAGDNKRLTLEINALVYNDGETLPPITVQTFHQAMDIDITAWQNFLARAKQIETVHGMLAGAGGTLVGIVLWWRRREDEAEG